VSCRNRLQSSTFPEGEHRPFLKAPGEGEEELGVKLLLVPHPRLRKHPLTIHNLLKKPFMFTGGGKGGTRFNLQPIVSLDNGKDCPRVKTTPLRNGLTRDVVGSSSVDAR